MSDMTLFLRALRVLAPIAILLPIPAFAQDCTIRASAQDAAPQYARPDDPWIYRSTDIPIDKGWLMGELPNGLRYAVRQNGVPPCQINMRIRIDAGSLHEEDDERGFAHLIEHLTFRESPDFGDGEAIPYFQRLGASLGSDTNAETSPTHTAYKLALPNANRETLEDSVRLFAGMIREPALSASNLALDVPIVLAERREQAGPNQRISDGTRSVFFAGQLLAERSPIGTLATLQGATPEGVRAFHDRWYRPENTVVVLVGDAEVNVLARLIEDYYADWEGEGPLTPAPDFGEPVAPAGTDPANPIGEVDVIVEPGQPRTFTYAILRPFVEVVDNLEYNRGLNLAYLATSIVNRRLENRARSGGNFLFAGTQRSKVSRSADVTYVAFSPLADDWDVALADVRGVIADALAQPPSQAEIDRAVSEMDIVFVNMVEQARIQSGRELADSLVGAVDIREAVAAPETFLNVLRNMNDRFTPDNLLQATRDLFTGDVIRAVYLTPQPGEANAAQVRAAMATPVVADGGARDDAEAVDFADLPGIGEPALPVTQEQLPYFSAEVLNFENGVRALLFSRDNEPGRVTVRVRFGGGWQAVGDDEGVYVELGQLALVNSGIGPLGQNELDAIAAGRKLSFGLKIEDGAFVFEGATRAEDLADQLYLFAAKLAMPRWDVAPFERVRASAEIAYDSYSSDPGGVLNRDLDWLLRDSDPRFRTSDPGTLAAATPERFRQVWSRLMAQGPLEVAVFGDIDRAATVVALSKTFGALEPREPLPADVTARALTFPEANAQPLRITHGGDPDQAAAVIAWPTGGGSEMATRGRKLDLLAEIFSNRLIEQMRERAGAAYSPFVTSNWPLDVDSGGMILAIVQLEPGLIPTFYEEAERIAGDLAANGPTADELARVVEPMKQYISRASTGHTFWLNQLEGGTFDRNRFDSLPALYSDFADATTEEMRSLAAQYLLTHGGYRIAIVPAEGGDPVAGR